jgi:hypothetical protein
MQVIHVIHVIHAQGKVAVIQQMNHDGEVNRARHMPQV